jgi:hypothetical protein
MRRISLLFFAAFFVFASGSCVDNSCLNDVKIIAVLQNPNNAKMVYIILKDQRGNYKKTDLYLANSITACGVTVHARDFIGHDNLFGALPGQEEEYQEYLQTQLAAKR